MTGKSNGNLHDPVQNRLLAALPESELARLRPYLEFVPLPLGKVIYRAGQQPTHLYFPLDCIVSKIYVLQDGETGEIAVVGNEGVVGIALFMGGETTPSQAIMQHEGSAYRLPGALARAEFYRARELQQVLLRFVQALLTQMGQTAICNRHHTIDQQLCRWLLLILDRLPSNEVSMTQELISHMLGVRREGVTLAASRLRKEGLITYQRGRIVVMDRPALEARACECYEVVRNEYDRLLSNLSHAGEPASFGRRR